MLGSVSDEHQRPRQAKKLLFVVNVGWFFVSHRLPIAVAAKSAGYEVHVATALDSKLDRDTEHRLRELGIVLHVLRLSRSGASPFELIRDCRDLYRLLRSLRPDVLHLVALKPVLLGGIIARLVNMPGVVLAIPGRGSIFSAKGMAAGCIRTLALLMYRCAYRPKKTRVIVQNIEDRNYFLDRKVFLQQDIRLVRGSGADTEHFVRTQESPGDVIVVLASRMLHEKGISDFVAAAMILQSQGVKARFVLVGTPDHGNPHSHTQDELEAWAASGVVEWWGFRPDMAVVFAECHIVCLPTYYGEGVPKVLIEAAASGRPIVTTNMPGCRDVVREGENGLLVQPRNPGRLAEALGRLIADNQLRVEMGKRGRLLAEKEFSLKIVTEKTLDIYEDLAIST